jgi:hypothetical protein
MERYKRTIAGTVRGPTESLPPTGAITKSRTTMPTMREVSQEATPPRRLRRPYSPSSLVQKLNRIFTQRPKVAGQSLPYGALSRENDARR